MLGCRPDLKSSPSNHGNEGTVCAANAETHTTTQSLTAPPGCGHAVFKVWGAGGGEGYEPNAFETAGNGGGGGGSSLVPLGGTATSGAGVIPGNSLDSDRAGADEGGQHGLDPTDGSAGLIIVSCET